MLLIRMHFKLITLLLITLISWNLFPRLASGLTDRNSQHIRETANVIVKQNQLTNEFQNNLHLLHTEEYFNEARKDLQKYHDLLKPPRIAFSSTDSRYSANLLRLCNDVIEISSYEFKNLSSVCLNQRLQQNFIEFSTKLAESRGTIEEREFLTNKVRKANEVAVDFYTENYSAYILHSQYSEIKKLLETMNTKLYDVFMEVKKYPNKLPSATTTSCT